MCISDRPFFSSLALLLSLPLALADAARHKVAGFPEAWHKDMYKRQTALDYPSAETGRAVNGGAFIRRSS